MARGGNGTEKCGVARALRYPGIGNAQDYRQSSDNGFAPSPLAPKAPETGIKHRDRIPAGENVQKTDLFGNPE